MMNVKKPRRILKFILIAIIALPLNGVVVGSCTMESDVEEPIITLSASDGTVRFSREASEQVVQVSTTSTAQWGLVSNGLWMKATRSGDNLIIEVEKNPTPSPRQATIVVTAGRASAQLTVIQDSGELSIVLLPEALKVDQFGGDYIVDVASNTFDWEATTDVDWLSITSMPYGKQLKLTVEPTKSREPREAIIGFTNNQNSSLTELTVKQDGIMWFELPYLDFENATIAKIMEFELDRYSNNTRGGAGFTNFHTVSNIFPMTAYYTASTDVGEAIVKARMYARDDDALKGEALEEFFAYLKTKGFSDENLPYDAKLFHPDKKIAVHVRVGINQPNYSDPHVAFIYTPDQPAPQKTFAHIDEAIGFTEFDKGHESVAAYEAERGGILKEGAITEENKTPNTQIYERPMQDGSGVMEVVYFYTWENGKSTVTMHRTAFPHPNYMFWTYHNAHGYITNEFRKLAMDSGFKGLPYVLFQDRRKMAFINTSTGWMLGGIHRYNVAEKRFELWLDSSPVGGGHTHEWDYLSISDLK